MVFPPCKTLRTQALALFSTNNCSLTYVEVVCPLEWLGILAAAGMTDNSSDLRECHFFYPQIFYGYWVPFDPDAAPDYRDDRETDPVEYNPSTMPILLPETVDFPRIRAGYPLGMIGEQYHRRSGESEAKEAGYYFVDHPRGSYCEKIP